MRAGQPASRECEIILEGIIHKIAKDMEEKDKKTEGAEQYELIFRNGALTNLKELARRFNIPENDLKQIVNKSIKLLTLTKDAKSLILEDKNGDRFRIDVGNL
ncbi:MAG: hypothetical protein G01um101429_1165 [Parcubacteria group bacterium Gr01-1014_29]|nr:MAG: hypothetical protein G01um101429_1165 [Parcubacteria group bacterium Gr01-1014_29]